MNETIGQIVGNGTLLIGDTDGSIRPRPDTVTGLFIRDTRFLSSWILQVQDYEMRVVSRTAAASKQGITSTPIVGRNETAPFLISVEQRVSGSGLDQTITVTNLTSQPISILVSLHLAGDFADPFTLRSDHRTFPAEGKSLHLTDTGIGFDALYTRSNSEHHFTAGMRVRADQDAHMSAQMDGDRPSQWTADVTWQVDLDIKAERALQISVGSTDPWAAPRPFSPTLAGATTVRAIDDLRSLQMSAPGLPDLDIIAAGAPWFLTLFGRDSLITLLLLQEDSRDLAPGILRALARTQGTTRDLRRNEQPGKILHELRISELAVLDEVPYGRYYGSVDSTPLFLIALAQHGDADLCRELESTARAAVAWMRGDGGIDATRFLRYTPDPDGLLHQGWKDSFDAVMHTDGSIATGDIALVEAQAYAWRALVETARLARNVWCDDTWADDLEECAGRLQTDTRALFWIDDLDFPALAVDGNDRRVDVVSSNAGHLLFAGILDDKDAKRVTDRLLEPDMYTGYGIRTLSTTAANYHPLSYHNGSVWPHDTMLAALGMAQSGFEKEARTIAKGIQSAAIALDNRLPELFGGFDRMDHAIPIAYPYAAAPQAWSTAAALAASRLALP